MTFYSDVLHKDMGVSVYVPKQVSTYKELPVLYFLHGRSGSEEVLSYFKMDELMESMIDQKLIQPFILVCPRMENSRGINSSQTTREIPGKYGVINNGRYEDYFIHEIIPMIEKEYSVIKSRNGRWIGGFSSGGHAALHYALRYPELFSKVGGHMPAVELTLEEEDIPYYGSQSVWEKYDPIHIAKNNEIPKDLQIYLDAGNCDEGHFYEGCKELADILQSNGNTVQNHVFPGHHNAQYISDNLRKYFTFYAGI